MTQSNFTQVKKDIDDIFKLNWVDTPIHFSGMSFDSTGKEKWINVVYEPAENMQSGISGSTTESRGMVYVVCWADYEYDAMALADSIVTLFNANLPAYIVNKEHNIIDIGYNENSKSFLVLAFPIKSYISGEC
jgi:hypothetical protein